MGMSHYKGKLCKITYPDCNTAETTSRAILKKKYKTKVFEKLDGKIIWKERLIDYYGDEYIILDDKVYKMKYEAIYDGEVSAIINTNGSIDFNVKFSDGSASLEDAIKWAMEDAVTVKPSADDVLADIRNKMSPVALYLSLVEEYLTGSSINDEVFQQVKDMLPEALKKAKESIDWLKDDNNF